MLNKWIELKTKYKNNNKGLVKEWEEYLYANTEDRGFVEALRERYIANQPNLSQSKLAQQIGVGKTTVREWLQGKHLPSFVQAQKLKSYLSNAVI